MQPSGRATALDWASVVAEVVPGLLDAVENLLEERFVLGLLAVNDHRQVGGCSGGPAPAAAAACGGAVRCRRGSMARPVRLLAPPQQLIIFHLNNRLILGMCMHVI